VDFMPVLTHNTPSKPRKTLEGEKKQQEETTMLLFGFHGCFLSADFRCNKKAVKKGRTST
jgi:hypothetical protein